jgi:hypothetical protein
MKNDQVVIAWKNGREARNSRGTLYTESLPSGGVALFSYDLKIGHRTAGGACILANYTAPVGGFKSMTTSCHVNLAKYCHGPVLVMHPLVWETSPVRERKPF